MIIGEYPCCGANLMIKVPDCPLPIFEKEICEVCGQTVWHYLSRIDPKTYLDRDFHEKFIVDEKTKSIKERSLTAP